MENSKRLRIVAKFCQIKTLEAVVTTLSPFNYAKLYSLRTKVASPLNISFPNITDVPNVGTHKSFFPKIGLCSTQGYCLKLKLKDSFENIK